MVVIVLWPDASRLDHTECHNGFGDCDVSANQIHPSTRTKRWRAVSLPMRRLDNLCRMGRMGVI